jgi:hypothetical protein
VHPDDGRNSPLQAKLHTSSLARSRPGYRIDGYAMMVMVIDFVLSIDIHAIAATILLSPFLLVVENDILGKLEVETVPILQD